MTHKHEPVSRYAELLRDERGAIYAESILTVTVGLAIAGLLAVAGLLVFAPRFESITNALYAGAP